MVIGPSDNKGEEKGSKGKDHVAQKEKEKTHGKATLGKSKMRKEKEEARGTARAKEKEGQRKVRRERQTCRKILLQASGAADGQWKMAFLLEFRGFTPGLVFTIEPSIYVYSLEFFLGPDICEVYFC